MDKVGRNKINQTTKFGKIGEYENKLRDKNIYFSPIPIFFNISAKFIAI